MSHQLRTLVEQHYENQTSGHPERDTDVFTSDVVSVIPGAPPMHSLDEFNQRGAAFATAFPDARFEIRNTIESENTIVVEGTYTGTHTGPLPTPQGEIPPTGRSVSVDYADVFVLKGDRFGEHRVYFDTSAFMSQLGLA